MTINLKTILLFSSILAVTLNVWQFASSYKQRETAFAPAWAEAATSPAPSPATKLATATSANPTPTTSPTPPTTAAPADPAAAIAATLSRAGLNPAYATLYLSVQQRTGTPWQLLAAVHKIETGQSGTTTRSSYAGATGPMQFMPATFRAYALDGNGDGITDIHNLDDAMLTAGRYLAAGGAAHGQYGPALYNYNHSNVYVNNVMAIAHRLGL